MIDSKEMHVLDEVTMPVQQETQLDEKVRHLVGQVVAIRTPRNTTKFGICRKVVGTTSLSVELRWGILTIQEQVPLTALIECIGRLSDEVLHAHTWRDIIRDAHRKGRLLYAQGAIQKFREETLYTFDDMCNHVGAGHQSLSDRMAVALFLLWTPHLFEQAISFVQGKGQATYSLASGWCERLENVQIPSLSWVVFAVRQPLGALIDLYRIEYHRATGGVRLSFYYPELAHERYGEMIATLALEMGIPIEIQPHPQQAALTRAAHASLPQGLEALGTPSIYFDSCSILVYCVGEYSSDEALKEAQNHFYEKTRWHLFIRTMRGSKIKISNSRQREPLSQSDAEDTAFGIVGDLPGFNRLDTDEETTTIVVRFYFPIVAMRYYSKYIQRVREITGWNVRIPSKTHMQVLLETVRSLLPQEIHYLRIETMRDEHRVRLSCVEDPPFDTLQHIQLQFLETTGWTLECVNAPQVRKWELGGVARYLLPSGLHAVKWRFDREKQSLSAVCAGDAPDAVRELATRRFVETTGWTLAVVSAEETRETTRDVETESRDREGEHEGRVLSYNPSPGERPTPHSHQVIIAQSVYSIPIEVLGLSAKTRALLSGNEITVGQILQMNEEMLWSLVHGEVLCLQELITSFQDFGFLFIETEGH